MMDCQRHLFSLPDGTHYLNGAYMSPQLKSVEAIGIENLRKKSIPFQITESDFFSGKDLVRGRFAQLIKAPDPQSIALIPSVSYGIANVVRNISFTKGDKVVLLHEQFPSNYYSWKQLERQGVELVTIKPPAVSAGRGANWNEAILDAIDDRTKVVALPHVHWADGTLFDLKAIRKKTTIYDALLVIDGTQSIGALPFSVAEIQPDALICGGYKWLLGPYSLGVAYFGPSFDLGTPIEDNWMNHLGSEDFSSLVNYNESLKPKAVRYDVGESSNFILVPMLAEALRILLDWTPQSIQEYAAMITYEGIEQLRACGHFVESEDYRAHHLFGVYLKDPIQLEHYKKRLLDNGIYVSYRGGAIRVSAHVYNQAHEFELLANCLK